MATETKHDEQALGGFYGWIERVGNKIPHPVYLFTWLLVITFFASLILNKLGVAAVHPVTAKVVPVLNMLTSEKIGLFFKNMGNKWMTFAPMITVPLCTLGLALSNHSGLLSASLKTAGASKSKWIVTLIVAFIGVNANLAGDAAFIVFPPLVAILYLNLGRNPLSGLFLAFGSVCVGFGANMIPGSADASLAGLTEAAAKVIDPQYVANPVMGWYYLFASTFLVTIICAVIDIKIIEPRLNKTGMGTSSLLSKTDIEYKPLSDLEKKGLKLTLLTIILFFVAVAALCLPGMPFAAPKNGTVMTGLLFKCIPFLIFALFFSAGYVYGAVVGTIKKFGDTIPMMTKELSTLGSFFLICFFAAQFISVFSDSGIATVIAIFGGGLLVHSGLPAPLLLALFVIVIMFINLFMGSANGKWALVSMIFVPMLMLAGIAPAATQSAYRMGDGLTNNITPTLPYLAIILGYAQEYDQRAKTGTVMAYMLPYTIITGVVWIAFLIIWSMLGIPMGPGYPAFM